LGRAGAAPRLLVSARDLQGNSRGRRALEDLVRAGVRVRVCKDSSKLALTARRAWLGSANATYSGGASNSTDWGVRTSDASIVERVRLRLEAQWANAKLFRSRRV
jgi:hypothetical protein